MQKADNRPYTCAASYRLMLLSVFFYFGMLCNLRDFISNIGTYMKKKRDGFNKYTYNQSQHTRVCKSIRQCIITVFNKKEKLIEQQKKKKESTCKKKT